MSWCGYIDLLGSRDDAKRSAQTLLESLDSFHSALNDSFDYFDGHCYAFSDGAFFMCEDYTAVVDFITRVRNQMFQASKYFRCSFIPGTIGVRTRKKRRSAKFNGDWISYVFTESAPEAYQRELTFKGVGCVVDTKRYRFDALEKRVESANAGADKERAIEELAAARKRLADFKSKKIVPSFFLEIDGRKIEIREIEDFRYSEFEISGSNDTIDKSYDNEIRIFDQLMSACYTALARSSKLASYYLSAFASIIRSMNLSSTDYSLDGREWIDAPYAFRELMAEGSVKLLKEVPGFHLILLACFDQLYLAHDGDLTPRAEMAAMTQLMRMPGCFRNLDRIPDAVISPQAKHRLVELKLIAARTARPHRRQKSA